MRYSASLGWFLMVLGIILGGYHIHQAFAESPQEMSCETLSFAYALAADVRDSGLSEERFIEMSSAELMRNDASQDAYFEMVKHVEYVYNRPEMTPGEIKQTTFQYCKDGDLK